MDRPTRVAQEDAEAHIQRRKLRGFFSDKSGVCGLCGCGLGKQYKREERRDHEKDFKHVKNHEIYKEAFGPAQEAYVEKMRLIRVNERKRERRELALQLQEEVGATAWIDHDDATRLKAALWDAMLNAAKVQEVQDILKQYDSIDHRIQFDASN